MKLFKIVTVGEGMTSHREYQPSNLDDLKAAAKELGYAVVPLEPTEEMKEAGRVATHGKVYVRDMVIGPRIMASDTYKAMIKEAL